MWVKYLFGCILSIISCWNLMLGIIKWVRYHIPQIGLAKIICCDRLGCFVQCLNIMWCLNQIQSRSKWCEVYKYVACFVCKSNALTHWWLLSCIFINIYLVYISRPYLCERRSVGDQYLIFDNTFSVTFTFSEKVQKKKAVRIFVSCTRHFSSFFLCFRSRKYEYHKFPEFISKDVSIY